MDYDENTLNSIPTMGPGGVPDGGARRPAEPSDEPSLGSAPTMVGQGVSAESLGQIDQYQLVRKLGGGGFGVVYLARDTVSGVEVALKTLHPLLKSNTEEMETLRAKFALVSRLSHPNIASPLVLHPCRDIVITDGEARREMRLSPGDSVMVMRYAPGETLSKWRRQFSVGVVPLDQALEVVRQIASALDYAHGEKIVHRDIKPANVMVETLPAEASQPSTRIRVRILDFGLAAEIRSSMSRISMETGDTSGTRPYMAPEQWLGKKQDGRTDQYALACVTYELLSGAPPFASVFETGDPIIMRTAVERDAPEEIAGVPPAVNAALVKALSKDPKDRFASCGDFIAALENTTALPRSYPIRKASSGKHLSVPTNRNSRSKGIVVSSGVKRWSYSSTWPFLIVAIVTLGAVVWFLFREQSTNSEFVPGKKVDTALQNDGEWQPSKWEADAERRAVAERRVRESMGHRLNVERNSDSEAIERQSVVRDVSTDYEREIDILMNSNKGMTRKSAKALVDTYGNAAKAQESINDAQMEAAEYFKAIEKMKSGSVDYEREIDILMNSNKGMTRKSAKALVDTYGNAAKAQESINDAQMEAAEYFKAIGKMKSGSVDK